MTKTETAPTFESALKDLEDVVQRLEKGELSLEDSLALYQRGIELSRTCHAKLEEAEGKIALLLKDAKGDVLRGPDGRPKTVPLPETGDDDAAV